MDPWLAKPRAVARPRRVLETAAPGRGISPRGESRRRCRARLAEDPVDAWLRHEGVSRRIGLRVPSYLQALHAVTRADLAAVVPKRLAESHAKALCLMLFDVR